MSLHPRFELFSDMLGGIRCLVVRGSLKTRLGFPASQGWGLPQDPLPAAISSGDIRVTISPFNALSSRMSLSWLSGKSHVLSRREFSTLGSNLRHFADNCDIVAALSPKPEGCASLHTVSYSLHSSGGERD
jgi:hypothetical protein